MKLLIIGSDYAWSIERHYYRYLLELNPETLLFSAQNRLFDYLGKSVIHKIRHKIGLTNIYQQINRELLDSVEQFKPELIWVFKGMQVLPSTLRHLKDKGIPLANYNPDNPYIFSGSGSGNRNVTDSLSLYNLFFTYNLEIKARLEKDFKKPVHFLPFGYDLSALNMEELMQVEEINRPCFVGNPDKQRAGFIKQLNSLGIKLDIYGTNWSRFISTSKNIVHPPVYGPEFYMTLRKYRVQLNIMRLHNLSSHNMRTFEIPAVGGIQLAPDTPEHRIFFDDGKQMFLYIDAPGCADKINTLVNLSDSESDAIRESARLKSEKSNYSYRGRTAFVFNILNSL